MFVVCSCHSKGLNKCFLGVIRLVFCTSLFSASKIALQQRVTLFPPSHLQYKLPLFSQAYWTGQPWDLRLESCSNETTCCSFTCIFVSPRNFLRHPSIAPRQPPKYTLSHCPLVIDNNEQWCCINIPFRSAVNSDDLLPYIDMVLLRNDLREKMRRPLGEYRLICLSQLLCCCFYSNGV